MFNIFMRLYPIIETLNDKMSINAFMTQKASPSFIMTLLKEKIRGSPP